MTRAQLFVAVKEICNAAGGRVNDVAMQVADAEMNRLIRAAVSEERERIAVLADELDATYTTTETGWGLGGPNSTMCTEHSFAARIREGVTP